MIEVRLENLETKVDGLAGGLAELTTKVDELAVGLDGLTTRVDGLTTKVDGLTTRVDGLTTQVDGLTTRVDGLTTKVDRVEVGLEQVRRDVRHEIGLAVELIRADIKAIPDHRSYIDQKMATGLATIRAEFGPRLDNVELALRRRRRS